MSEERRAERWRGAGKCKQMRNELRFLILNNIFVYFYILKIKEPIKDSKNIRRLSKTKAKYNVCIKL